MPFTLTRRPLDLVARRVSVTAVTDLTPTYRRITLGGNDLAGFDSPGADDHLRIFFAEGVSREYTPVAWNGRDRLDLDFVLHGDGAASTWAQNAAIGDEVRVGGPRGSLVLEGAPEWWLLAGDETALPAIRRHLAAVAPGTPVTAVVALAPGSAEQPLESPGALDLRWVRIPAGAPAGSPDALVETLRALPRRLGSDSADGFAFVAAEQSVVKPARALLFDDWGLEPDHAIVKGYWKRGEAEYHAPH